MTRRKPKTQRADRAIVARRLIEQLQLAPMTASDIREFLGYGPSGAGKYARDLHRAGVTTCVTSGLQHVKTYTLIGDPAAIEAFFVDLATRQNAPRAKRDQLSTAIRRGGRYFHLLADDTYNQTKVASTAVAPDPLALMREFFQSSGDSIPAIVRADPAVPPAPTGFAALTVDFKLRLPDQAKVDKAAARKKERRGERMRKVLIAECREVTDFFGKLAAAPGLRSPGDRLDLGSST